MTEDKNERIMFLLMIIMLVFSSFIIIDNIGLRKELKDINNHKLLDVVEIKSIPVDIHSNLYYGNDSTNYTKIAIGYGNERRYFSNVTNLIKHESGWKEFDSDGKHEIIIGDISYYEYLNKIYGITESITYYNTQNQINLSNITYHLE